MTLFKLSTVALIVGLSAPTAFASITTGDLVLNVVNHLEDNDFEGGLLANGTTLEVGDTLFGIFRIQDLNVPPFGGAVASDPGIGPGTTFAGAFMTTVLTKAGAGPFTWTFGPSPGALWAAIFGGYIPTAAGSTMVSVFQDSTNPRILDGSPTTGVDGVPLWEFGFTGALGVAAGFEFWTASAPTDAVLGLSPAAPATFSNGLNLTANATSLDFVPHNFLGNAGPTDLQGFGTVFNNPATADGTPTPLASDTDFFVVPTPEPASLAIWGLICTIGALFGYRRRSAA